LLTSLADCHLLISIGRGRDSIGEFRL